MKKFVVLIAAGLLMLAFGTVYAQEKAPVLEFKASGFIDVISEYMKNVPQPGADNFSGTFGTSTNNVMFGPPAAYMRPSTTDNLAFDKAKAYMETRGRLKFDAILGKEMTGTFFFEIDSQRWGERAPGGTGLPATVAGDNAILAGDQRNYAGHWGVADRGSVEVKNLFFTFGVPFIPVPTTIQAGIHPLYIRSSAFCATEGPGITAAVKIDPAMIKLMWFKALENRDWASDDADIYAIEANAKIQTFTIGGYVFNFNMNSYPIGDQRFAIGATGTPGASLPGPSVRSDMWWYGLYADGKVGPVNINFDFVYDRGKHEDRRQNVARARDVKFRGFGLIGNVGFPWEKFLFGISSIYGSGADMNKTSSKGYPGDPVGSGLSGVISSKAGAYIIPAGTEGTAGHSLILCGNGINRNNTGFEPALSTNHGRATFGGLWINKLYGAFQVSPEFLTRIEAMWIRDTSKNGNTIGNALTTAGLTRDDKDVGWEVDWLNTLLIYKNLSFQFGGGILIAGDAMDYAVQGAASGTNKSPKNPYVITTNLTYSF